MAFITGTGTKMLWLKESAFGTTPSTKTSASLINLTSEGLSVSVEKGDEGNLLASKTATNRDLMSISVSGSVSSILRPEFADILLETALGKKATVTDSTIPSGYTQTKYTLGDAGSTLPSFTAFLNRGTGYKVYSGLTANNTSIECTANDYVKISSDLMGYKETNGTTSDATTLNAKSYSKPSYRCTQAEMKVNDTVFDVETCTVAINNALVEAPKTYNSGLYAGQPQPATREVTASFTIPYSSAVDTFKDSYLESETNASIVLKFTTSDANEFIQITIPNVAITSVSNNVSGTGLVEASVEGTALSVGSVEPVTIVMQTK